LKGSSEHLSLLDRIQHWVKEPPPEYLFEISERGLAFVQPRNPSSLHISPLSEKALAVSPSEPNIIRVDVFQNAFPKNGSGPRRAKAGLVIPDYAARISVIDFDELPNDEEQRLALVRFRLKKGVPFSIDDAQVSYSIQPANPQRKKLEVLAAAIARPVLTEYETLLRNFGYQVGLVVPSSVAALPLYPDLPGALTLVAKISGNIFSIVLLENRQIRVFRCVDLASEESVPEDQPELMSTLLQQTLAFAEDEWNQPVQHLVLCGFGSQTDDVGLAFEREFGVSWAPLRSRFGVPSQENAGLYGMLEQYA
jgi:type IV pilus assembly protein PilM